MIQYTTPTITLRLKNVELDPTDVVKLTLQPVNKSSKNPVGDPLVFVNPTTTVADGHTRITVRLTQVQSASLPKGLVAVQANWKTTGGIRGASKRVYITVDENLLAEEM